VIGNYLVRCMLTYLKYLKVTYRHTGIDSSTSSTNIDLERYTLDTKELQKSTRTCDTVYDEYKGWLILDEAKIDNYISILLDIDIDIRDVTTILKVKRKFIG